MFIIGLDLDGVSGKYVEGLRAAVAKKLSMLPEDIAAQLPDPTDYAFSNWKVIGDEFKKFHTDAVDEGLYATLEAFEGVSETLWRLSDDDFHIRVITSRFVKHGQNGKVVSDTAYWLDDINIPYRSLHFEKNKVDSYADVYIDDAPSNIEAFQAAGRDYIIFDAPYNQHLEGARAYNWADVYRLVHEFRDAKVAREAAALAS